MKYLLSLLALVGIFSVALFPNIAKAKMADDKLEAKDLRTMIVNMGYEVKDLNSEKDKEKYEFAMTKGGFNVPMSAEISPSKNYIWLTISLGKQEDNDAFKTKAGKLIKRNYKVQPCQFYVTDRSNLMMGYAIENRSVNAAWLKKCVEKISDDLVDSADDWQ